MTWVPSVVSQLPIHVAFKRLEALVDWERAKRAQMCVDLSPQIDLMKRLGRPHLRPMTVHVTGTKGKGSVSALIEAGLRSAGWKVGRYGSPHLQTLNERVSIDGQPIESEFLEVCLSRALDARDAAYEASTPAKDATWFDVMTAAAFVAFEQAGMEWVVVEVGLGGRLDATNVVEPQICVITNIGLEHTDVLGKTRAEIAMQKAGIIKRGIPIITGVTPDDEAGKVIENVARAVLAPVTFVPVASLSGIGPKNLALAKEVLQALGRVQGVINRLLNRPLMGADLTQDLVLSCRLPGRMERRSIPAGVDGIERRIDVVLDGAHVDFALTNVVEELRLEPRYRAPMIVVLALGADKDPHAIFDALGGIAEWVICTSLEHGRPCWTANDLALIGSGLNLKTVGIPDLDAAFEHAKALVTQDPNETSWILITGSLHLVGAIRSRL